MQSGWMARIDTMRARMLEANDVPTSGFDVKGSRGGIIDMEFIAQSLQFWLAERGAIATSARSDVVSGQQIEPGVPSQNTFEALSSFAHEPLVTKAFPAFSGEQMSRDYLALRRIEALLRLDDGHAHSARVPEDVAAKRVLARLMGFSGAGALTQLDALIEAIRARAAEAFAHVISSHAPIQDSDRS